MATLLETDPVVFKRTTTGDLMFPLQVARGLEAVAIGIRTRLQMCRGEWFLDLDKGIPYLPHEGLSEAIVILGKAFDPINVRAAFLREILSTPGVVDVPLLRMKFNSATRVLTLSWRAKTRFGDTPIDTLSLEII